MDIGIIDYWANSGTSVLHRASAPAKVVATALLIGAVVLATDLLVVLTIWLAVAAAVFSTRLPALRIIAAALYPAVFALPFAISRWDGSAITPAVIVLRATASALVMLLLLVTTPYPRVLGTLDRWLPGVLRDGLLLTYRSLFILLKVVGDIWRALRLRGGVSRARPVRSVANVASALGLLVLRAVALSQRLYDVLRLRGYAGRLAAGERAAKPSPYDLYPLGLGLLLAGLALATRLWPAVMVGAAGYALLVALVGLLSSAAYARRAGRREAGGG